MTRSYPKRKPVLKSALLASTLTSGADVNGDTNKSGSKTPASNSELLKTLSELEPQRVKVREFTLYGILGISPFVAAIFINDMVEGFVPLTYLLVLLIPFLGGMVCAGIAYTKYQAYKKDYKHGIVAEIFASIAPELSYKAEEHISPGVYMASKLFRRSYDRYNGDDFLFGKMGQTDVMFSEIHSEYYTKGKNNSKNWHTIFKGFFFTADFHKEISGETYVLPDIAEKRLGFVGKMLQKKNPFKHAGELVKLENKAFEKEFVVYSSDQIEARYCLTPSMMESLVKLQKQFKYKVYISFIHSNVNIAISSRKNNFEPRIFKSGVDPALITEMRELFTLLTSIVEELNLNTRIWGKKAA